MTDYDLDDADADRDAGRDVGELNDHVIERAVHDGESMDFGDLFDYVERYHDDGRPGVTREALAAYAERLDGRSDYRLDVDGFLDLVDGRATDSETWAGPDHFYRLDDGRLSKFPARWHEALGGSTDVAAYLRFVRDEAPEFVDDTKKSGPGSGIPEDTLMHLVQVVGRVDRETARDALAAARDEDVVVEDLDQHPQTDVYLAEEAPNRGDQSVQGDR